MAIMLVICSEEIVSKYQIMIRAKLNSKGLERYLKILLAAGFVTQPGIDFFQTSLKGSEFVKHNRILKSTLGERQVIGA
jgi:predicted transcriptional regulator